MELSLHVSVVYVSNTIINPSVQLFTRFSFLWQEEIRTSNEVSYWLSQSVPFIMLKGRGFLRIFGKNDSEKARKSAYVFAFLGFNCYLLSSVFIVLDFEPFTN